MDGRLPGFSSRVLFPVGGRVVREEAAGGDDGAGSAENAALVGEPAVTAQETGRLQPVRVEAGVVRADEVQQAAGPAAQLLRRRVLRHVDAQIVQRLLQQDQTVLQEGLRRELDLLRERREEPGERAGPRRRDLVDLAEKSRIVILYARFYSAFSRDVKRGKTEEISSEFR